MPPVSEPGVLNETALDLAGAFFWGGCFDCGKELALTGGGENWLDKDFDSPSVFPDCFCLRRENAGVQMLDPVDVYSLQHWVQRGGVQVTI